MLIAFQVPLESFYPHPGLYIKSYPHRGTSSHCGYRMLTVIYCGCIQPWENGCRLLWPISLNIKLPLEQQPKFLPIDRSREHLQCWVSGTNGRLLMSTNYIPDVTADEVQEQQPPKHLATSKGSDSSQLLACIDSASGITRQQFQKLFKKCSLCGSIMMHWAFHDHGCIMIDLTTDSD